jgi:hypothetical protein
MNSQLPFFSGDADSGLAVTNPESTDSEFFLGGLQELRRFFATRVRERRRTLGHNLHLKWNLQELDFLVPTAGGRGTRDKVPLGALC